jgi:hypothetical protein
MDSPWQEAGVVVFKLLIPNNYVEFGWYNFSDYQVLEAGISESSILITWYP